MKKFLAIVLATVMVASMFVIGASAFEGTIEDNSSLHLLIPNSNGQYRIYFGDITESVTLTWYVQLYESYLDDQDGFFYKLYDGDTFVGGFESNCYAGMGQYLHVNTTLADRGVTWSGSMADETSAKLNMDGWNRLDLVVDFENHTIAGYVNYVKVYEMLEFSEEITSFDHLKIGGYRNGYRPVKRVYIDNVMLRKGTQAPSITDIAVNNSVSKISAAQDVLMFLPMNSDTQIIHYSTEAVTYESGKIYHYRSYMNTNFCHLNDSCPFDISVGMAAPIIPVPYDDNALRITPKAVEWGYKGFIYLSDELIDYDSTVSFYIKTNEYPDGWCHRLGLVLSDAIGKANDSQTMGGVVSCGNQNRTEKSRGFGYFTYDTNENYYTTYYWPGENGEEYIEFKAGEWFRIDMLVDFETGTTDLYINGIKYATLNHSPDAVGYKGLKSYTVSSGNYEQEFYIDEIVVREGLIVPEENDVIANKDRTRIEADTNVVAYEPFDILHRNTVSNTAKWEYSLVESDLGMKASSDINKMYKVIWNIDGKITTEYVRKGNIPTAPTDTYKKADAQYTYTFIGWDKAITAVTGDVTYTAQYSKTANKYTVTWYVGGKTITDSVAYGTVPTAPTDTYKAADVQYTYTFIGWDKAITAVTGDVTYTAQYSKTVNKYTVTWYVGGKTITDSVTYGTIPTAPANTYKEADALYTYTFTGWNKAIVAVDGNVTYTAQYKTTAKADDLESKIDELYDAIAKLEDELDKTNSELEDAKIEFENTKTELENVKDEFENAKAELEDAKAELDDMKEEFDKTKSDLYRAMETVNNIGGGCSSVSLGTVIALTVGLFGAGFTVIKKK